VYTKGKTQGLFNYDIALSCLVAVDDENILDTISEFLKVHVPSCLTDLAKVQEETEVKDLFFSQFDIVDRSAILISCEE
jgi:hypothetical protein